MQAVLKALTSELRRLKANGVKTVSVAPETLQALRSVVNERIRNQSGGQAELGGGSTESTPVSSRSPLPSSSTSEAWSVSGTEKPPLKSATSSVAASSPSLLPPPPQVTLPVGSKSERLAWLQEKVLGDPVCQEHLRPGKKAVVGVGNLDATIFFCGEAPGAEEEVLGEPFVGPAGQLLTRMIQAMGLKREQVYIGNIMNWRPDLPTPAGQEQIGNRPPTPEELSYCLPYLRAQLEIVDPQVIVALGSTAAQGLFGVGSFRTLGEIRGRWKLFSDKPVMVTYHPSYILRNASNRSKRAIWEDLLKVMEKVDLTISEKQRGFFLDK